MGKVSQLGWHILSESIRMVQKVYPEFDIVVCYNNLNNVEELQLKSLNVQLVNQNSIEREFSFIDDDEGKVRNFCWKLMPTRLRLNAHELWIDNDIIIRDRIEAVDKWLNSNTSLISRGFNKDYGRFIDCDVLLDNPACCAGFFGLPPHFDLLKELNHLIGKEPLSGFDEQGLVSLIACSFKNYYLLSHRDMVLLSEIWKPRPDFWFPSGLHFSRSNRFNDHVAWRIYKTAVMP